MFRIDFKLCIVRNTHTGRCPACLRHLCVQQRSNSYTGLRSASSSK